MPVTFPAAHVTPVHVDVVSPLQGKAPDQLASVLPDVSAAAKPTSELGGGGGGGDGFGGGGLGGGGVTAAAHVARDTTRRLQASTPRADARPLPLSEAAARPAVVERLRRSAALAPVAAWRSRESAARASAAHMSRRHASDAWLSAARRRLATRSFPAYACAGAATASLCGSHMWCRRCRVEGHPDAHADCDRVKQTQHPSGMRRGRSEGDCRQSATSAAAKRRAHLSNRAIAPV